jgi:hypothetical protein
MTFREAVAVNTRLQEGRPVPREERLALAVYLTERVDADDAEIPELTAMLFMAEHVRSELNALWMDGSHGRRARLAC